MTKRLEILKKSLEKKQAKFDNKIDAHFIDVRSTNGQPLNDKKDGYKTFNRWEKQNESLRNAQKDIEKTKIALEKEQDKIDCCQRTLEKLPKPILELLQDGTLIQWRKYPNFFFVNGVEKARLNFDLKKKILFHRFSSAIPTNEQRQIFREVYNKLAKEINEQT